MRHWMLAIPFVLVAAACDDADSPDGDDHSGGSGAGTTQAGGANPDGGSTNVGGGSVNPPGESIKLTLEPFDVQPGTERQVCKIINLPAGADVDIVRMSSTMLGTSHHFNAYKVLAGDVAAPVTQEEATVDDCSPASGQLDGSAAYIFGAATPERIVDMPEKVAFHLVDQQRIILEQHVINATQEVIQGGVELDLVMAGEEAQIEHHADIMWMANWGIFLPPNQETVLTEHCTVPYDVEVFGLMSHTHALGTHFSIEKWSDGATEHVYDSTDWAHPIYQQMAPAMSVAQGHGFEWTCTYSNTTGQAVQAGPESTNEMCMMFAYAYPKNGLSAEPFQCNKF